MVHDAVHRRRRRYGARHDRDFTDRAFNNGGVRAPEPDLRRTGSKWNFAWALHAGLAYKVKPNITVELGYSYLDLGNGMTGVDQHLRRLPTPSAHAFQFKNITSQGREARRALEPRQPAGYAAAAGPQGLIELFIVNVLTARDFPAPFCFARIAIATIAAVFGKIMPIERRDNDWLRLTGDDRAKFEYAMERCDA